MSFPLVGSPGALFNSWGQMGAVIAKVNSAQATMQNTLILSPTGLYGQLEGQPDIAATVGTSWPGWLAGFESPCGSMQALAQQYINRLVYNAQPQLNQTLTSINLSASIGYVYEIMLAQGATILQMSVASTSTPFVGQGNGVVTCSLKRPFDGRFLENAYAEVITFTCSADSYTGGTAAFNERFVVTGEGSQNDLFAYNWPLGSNASINLSAIDGGTSNGSGNFLTNSGFDAWTSSVPNNWTVNAGGSTISQSSTISFSAGSSLLITGDGSSLTSISQPFNSSAGTTSTLALQNQYSVNLFLRAGGSAPSQGVLQVDLVDGGGNIINDQGGTPNSFTINLAGMGVGWNAYNGFFRIPVIFPGTYSIRYHLTQALNSGAVVYMDKTSLGLTQQLYAQGPFVACHSGSIPFQSSPISDYATANVTNSRGAGGTLNTWQTLLYRLLGTAVGVELLWPSNPSPTISDSLIS